MTHNEKKSLYESIMRNVAKTVKRKLNESLATQKNDINIYIESSDCWILITEKDVVRKSLMQEQDKTMQEIAFVLNKLKKKLLKRNQVRYYLI